MLRTPVSCAWIVASAKKALRCAEVLGVKHKNSLSKFIIMKLQHMEIIANKIAKRENVMRGIEAKIIGKKTGITFKSSTCENPFEQLSFLVS
jgi:hypothetical protein